MKIKKMNAGVLTNFEVLDFLRSRGAKSDPLECLGAVRPSECKVFDYFNQTAACNQTREAVNEFWNRCGKFKQLAKAEKLNIINLRPSTLAEIFSIVEEPEARLVKDEVKSIQELVDLVVEVLPPPPPKPEIEMDEEVLPPAPEEPVEVDPVDGME